MGFPTLCSTSIEANFDGSELWFYGQVVEEWWPWCARKQMFTQMMYWMVSLLSWYGEWS